MEKAKEASQNEHTMATANLEQARKAMENYLQFFQKGMSVAPWMGTDLNRKLTEYAQKNVAQAFNFAQRLSQSRNLQEVMQIQTEFFQAQLKSLTEQAKDLTETVPKPSTKV